MPRKTNITEKVHALRRFHQQEHRVPGYTEMLELFGYRSKNAVHRLLGRLEDLGYLSRNRQGKLSFTPKLTGSIKLVGSVQAGFPSPAEEELVDTLSLDAYLVEKPESTFMLTVSGDSMIDAGIHPGDIILIQKGIKPRKNEIVVAQVDGEWTLKYFGRDRQGIYLDPANAKYTRIRPRQSLEIGGVVKAVIRKYG
jgi:repressor LexA